MATLDLVSAGETNWATQQNANLTALNTELIATTAKANAAQVAADLDDDTAALAADSGSALRTELNAAIDGEIGPVRSRGVSRELELAHPGRLQRVEVDSRVLAREHVPVLTDGLSYVAGCDVTQFAPLVGETFYLHSQGASAQHGKSVGTVTSEIAAGTVISALPVTATAGVIASGWTVAVFTEDRLLGVLRASAHAAAGATSIPVNPMSIPFTIPVGAVVAPPKQSIYNALVAASAGDEIVLLERFNFRSATSVDPIQKNIRIRGLHADTKVTVSDNLAWALASGTEHTYQAARTNVRIFVDMSPFALDGVEYQRVATLAEVESTPGSWHQASDGTGLVSVHTLSGGAPDSTQHLALLETSHFQVVAGASDMTVYYENLTIIGGGAGVGATATAGGALWMLGKDCRFLWGGYGAHGASTLSQLRNGYNVLGKVYSIMQDVVCANSALDNFNYHASGTNIGWSVEIGCEGHSAGLMSISVALAVQPNCNATTAHDGWTVLRVLGLYHHAYGPPMADVHDGTVSDNYGSKAWASLAPAGAYNAAISAQQTGSVILLHGVLTWGALYHLYCVTGAQIIGDDVQYDTIGGSGAAAITIANRR